jgi:hypothetical protein
MCKEVVVVVNSHNDKNRGRYVLTRKEEQGARGSRRGTRKARARGASGSAPAAARLPISPSVRRPNRAQKR